MEETLKNNKYNTVDFKTYNQAFMELSNSVKMLTERVGEVLVKLDKQDERINALEDKPGSLAIKGWAFVATAIGTAIMGIIIGLFMKGGM